MTIHAALWGTATKNGEVRQSKAGNDFGTVNLAVSDGKTDENGREILTFARILLFGHLAGEAAKISKGDRAYVEGQLQASVYHHESGPRVDLTIRGFKFEPTQIGKARPKKEDAETYFKKDHGGHRRTPPPIQGRDEWADEIPI